MSLQHTVKSVKALIKDPITRVPHEVKMRRMKICMGCEFRNKTGCNLCKCKLSLKVGLAKQFCPINKWAEWLPDNPNHEPFPPIENCNCENENTHTNV